MHWDSSKRPNTSKATDTNTIIKLGLYLAEMLHQGDSNWVRQKAGKKRRRRDWNDQELCSKIFKYASKNKWKSLWNSNSPLRLSARSICNSIKYQKWWEKKRKGSWEAFVGMCLHIKSLSLVMSIYSLVAINKLYLNLNRIIKNEIYGNFSSLY